jgi:hypothetical protein
MDEREQRIRALEAEMLAMMGVVAEVFRRLAQIDPQHHAAVRAGFDTVFRTLSQARDNTANAGMRSGFDHALKSMEWLTLSALAPSQGGKAHGTVQ